MNETKPENKPKGLLLQLVPDTVEKFAGYGLVGTGIVLMHFHDILPQEVFNILVGVVIILMGLSDLSEAWSDA